MFRSMRPIIRRVTPKAPLYAAWESYTRFKSRAARAAFQQAATTPAWLGRDELARLQAQYPLRPTNYRYDPAGLEQTARQRNREMLHPVRHETDRLHVFLDLGTWDGTQCDLLQKAGKQAHGIDTRVEGISESIKAGGARFAQMDVAHLGYADNRFDFVFSYNSFEHFPDPERALSEAWRVVRPGGYIYLNFGPLYYTPRGSHQYDTISVPYCECLFPDELLAEYAESNGLDLKPFEWMNRWRYSQYRALWDRFADRLKVIDYHEIFVPDHVELIERYPTCFRSKTADFDDLIVSNIEALFQKRYPGE